MFFCGHPGEDFLSPAFPEIRVLFFLAQPWESKRKFFLRLVNRLSLIHLRSALQELIQTLIYFLLYQTRLKLVFISAEIIIQYIKPDWNMGTVSKEVLPLSVLKSSHLRCCSVKKVLLKISQKTCNFIKKRFQHSYFPVKIMKFLRTLISRSSANECPFELMLQQKRYAH